jgi:hypothetical protein
MKIAELMGNTILTEESFFVGFLPLQSYIDHKKQIGNGVKCPLERENLVRSLILKDHLEQLKCTMEDLKSQSSIGSEHMSIKTQEETKEEEDFFA